MTKRDYLNNLLQLMTEEQLKLFERMYPNDPTDRQVAHAIVQCENTLKGLNKKVQRLTNVDKEFKTFKEQCKIDAQVCSNKIDVLEHELNKINVLAEQLSNPIATDNAEIQDRLAKLDALEAGGVDNWTWYGESMEQAGL